MTRTQIFSFVVIAILLVLGVASYLFLRPSASPASATAQEASSTAGASPSTTSPEMSLTDSSAPPAGWKEYSNPAYHFLLYYPPDLALTEHVEPGGEHTAVFDDSSNNYGFQIFIVPYSGTQITQARFNLDEPSGVMQSPVDVIIDGTRGTIFYSNNALMGDTRELWFIRDGLLYEVTTYKPLDTWLADIMKTWKFTN